MSNYDVGQVYRVVGMYPNGETPPTNTNNRLFWQEGEKIILIEYEPDEDDWIVYRGDGSKVRVALHWLVSYAVPVNE